MGFSTEKAHVVSSKDSRSQAMGQWVGSKQEEAGDGCRLLGTHSQCAGIPSGAVHHGSCLSTRPSCPLQFVHLSLSSPAVRKPVWKAQGSEELKIRNVFGEKTIMKVMRLNCLQSIWLLIP